jgi:large subunit ribosomal protein L9
VEVNDGYARNYLFPRKIAIEANASNMNVYRSRKNAQENKTEREIRHANELKEKLLGVQVVIKAKAGENGKLFGAVTNNDIAVFLNDKGFDIEKKKIILDETIKSLGTYEASVKLYANISAKVKVTVEKE